MLTQRGQESNNEIRFHSKMKRAGLDTGNTLKSGYPPFVASRIAGIKNMYAVGQLFKIEVAKMVESIPDARMVKNSFCWWKPVKNMNPAAWNRLVGLAPLIKQLRSENKRLAVPYVTDHLWHWLCGDVKKRPEAANIAPDKAISAWRASLLQRGLTPGAWRWVTHLSSPQLMALVARQSGHDPWDDMIPMLNFIVTRQLPVTDSIKWIKGNLITVADKIRDQRVFALWEAVIVYRHLNRKVMRTKEGREKFNNELSEEIRNIQDYFIGDAIRVDLPDPASLLAVGAAWPDPDYANEGVSIAITKKVSFQWFRHRCETWHKKMASVWTERYEVQRVISEYENREWNEANRIREEFRTRLAWESALPEKKIGDYEVLPLTTGMSLAEEGAEMRHCVSGYTEICLRNGHRIFSIRKEGHRIATVEIAPGRANGAWRVIQVKGKCNGLVPDSVVAVAKLVVKAYSSAARLVSA